jgi:hypothetical protein
MAKLKKTTPEKDNTSYLEVNPRNLREKALQALEKAKALEASRLANGQKWVRINVKTEVLR